MIYSYYYTILPTSTYFGCLDTTYLSNYGYFHMMRYITTKNNAIIFSVYKRLPGYLLLLVCVIVMSSPNNHCECPIIITIRSRSA